MGIFERFSKMVKAEINNLLDKAEDKTKLKEQKILDLNESKKEAKKLLVSSMGAKKIALKEQEILQQRLSKIEDEAQAIQDGEEPNKIKDLQEDLRQKISHIHEEILSYDKTIAIINHGIEAIDKKLQALKFDSEDTEALRDTSSFDTFDRMEEKINNQEAEIEALTELLKDNDNENRIPNIDNLENELEIIKRKMRKK